MGWNEIMAKELKRAKTGAPLSKVPPNRKPTAKSLQKLIDDICIQIRDNDQMRFKSKKP